MTIMSNIIEASKDSEWVSLGKNFVEVATANASTLGLTAAQVSGLTATYDGFDSNMQNAEAKIAEKEAAIIAKDTSLQSFETLVRRYAKQWRGTAAVSDELLAQLNLAPKSSKRSKTTPTQPLNLIANVNSVGEVKLAWKRNGNISGTTFWIQTQEPGDTSWTLVGTTTKAKFTFTGNPIGQELSFRVIAVRREIESTPSFAVTIFGGSESSLRIAA